MAMSQPLRVGFALALLVPFAGCESDDGASNAVTGGTGGSSAGSAGKGTGGSSAGKGGAAGTGSAGKGGAAGTGSAGKGGGAGTGGGAGKGGAAGSGGAAGEGGAGGEAGSTGDSLCERGCVATLEADCPLGPSTQQQCVADCERLSNGACSTEYAALQACAEGEEITCGSSGIPVIAACSTEQDEFIACIN
jgi:hypothetical protein